MIWFKHDTNSTNDAKVKKLLLKYGAEGYAIYFHCIELIAGDTNENNITFELEHDSEIIADNLKIKGTAEQSGIDKVQEIMQYIVELGLFQERNNHIFCFKLLKRLDLSMTSNPKMRKLITEAKEHHDGVMTESCKKRREEIRLDKIRLEETDDSEIKLAFDRFWNKYDKKVSREKCFNKFKKLKQSEIDTIFKTLDIYIKSTPDKKYRLNPKTYLNNKSWNDEIILKFDENNNQVFQDELTIATPEQYDKLMNTELK